MNIEACRIYCLSLKGTTEGMPFDNYTLVFSVKGKMFCLTNIDTFKFINLKCDPEKALELRAMFDAVTPGYHMNKMHWNSIKMDETISDKEIKTWIKHSYDLVVSKLSKKIQMELKND